MDLRADSALLAAPRSFAIAMTCAWLVAVASGDARGQSHPGSQAAAKISETVERWLATDQTSRDGLDECVKVLLAEAGVGIAWLAGQMPAALAAPAEPRSKGVQTLITHSSLEFLRRQRASNITFQGQYAALLPLQPIVGDLLFGLLLETPEWYPLTHRIHLVAPLRDLQARPPVSARLDAVVAIVEDARFEPEGLRRALAALLWQWGTKQHGQAMIAAMVAASGEGDGEERVQATLELADFYTQLREYKQAATTHRSAQTLAKGANVMLRPIAWYSAACVHALLGDNERGIAALEQCTAQLASPDLDSSVRLPRSMFDQDPELAILRQHTKWNDLMRRAFPPTVPAGGR